MKLGKALFVFPTLFTLTSVFLGILAIISAAEGRFVASALSVVFAGLFDSMDGRVARLTRTQSRFGVQIDSLADVVSFGVAPAILLYFSLFKDRLMVGTVDCGILACFLFVAAGAIRLARYNVENATPRGVKMFSGLPIPGAAGCLATLVLGVIREGRVLPAWTAMTFVVLLSVLMVTTIPYRKAIQFRSLDTLVLLVLLLLFMVSVALWRQEYVLFSFFFFYLVSGPLEGLVSLATSRRRRQPRRGGG